MNNPAPKTIFAFQQRIFATNVTDARQKAQLRLHTLRVFLTQQAPDDFDQEAFPCHVEYGSFLHTQQEFT